MTKTIKTLLIAAGIVASGMAVAAPSAQDRMDAAAFCAGANLNVFAMASAAGNTGVQAAVAKNANRIMAPYKNNATFDKKTADAINYFSAKRMPLEKLTEIIQQCNNTF